ncbi:MAG: hypothetical protein ACJ8CB_18505 [Ktedonobacteraceae bacterium]
MDEHATLSGRLSQGFALKSSLLFASIKPAVDFMHVSDEQVRAPAPFFVFGIWLIKKGEGL